MAGIGVGEHSMPVVIGAEEKRRGLLRRGVVIELDVQLRNEIGSGESPDGGVAARGRSGGRELSPQHRLNGRHEERAGNSLAGDVADGEREALVGELDKVK